MSELWIPITAMICVAIVTVANLILSAHVKKAVQKTLQQHLENGGLLTPDLLKHLGANPDSSKTELKKGFVLTSVGIACLAAGFASSNLTIGLVFGVFPLFIGFAFCITALLNK